MVWGMWNCADGEDGVDFMDCVDCVNFFNCVTSFARLPKRRVIYTPWQNPPWSHQNRLKSSDFQDQGTSMRNFSDLQQIRVFLQQANPPHPKGPSRPGAPNPPGAHSAWRDFNLNLTWN